MADNEEKESLRILIQVLSEEKKYQRTTQHWFFYSASTAYGFLLWQHNEVVALLGDCCCAQITFLVVLALFTAWGGFWIRARNQSYSGVDKDIRKSTRNLLRPNCRLIPEALKLKSRTSSCQKFFRGWGLFVAVHILLYVAIFISICC